MKSNNILIIEDEFKVAQFIKRGLEENDFDAEIAYDGFTGERMILSKEYDLIILDINLPMKNGFELCKVIRNTNAKVPVLMLTALSSTDDKLMGFDIGADDYMVKPFEFKELLARIKALLKRSKFSDSYKNVLKVADLVLDNNAKTVKRGSTIIELTAKEFLLLDYLMRNKGRVVSRVEIAEKIWDITFDTGTNIIDVYVNFLRKKIDKNFSPKLIHTVIGMGYVLKENDE
ncbi:MAG TPA: response regulator transcription factor [Bacteroidales bacterium]|nr:response regulator transcription factor [Bacteroidales bacterium]